MGIVKLELQSLISSPNSCVFIHDNGAIGGRISRLPFGPGNMAQEVFWWAERGGLILMRAYEDWAQEKGASVICMASLPNSRVDAIYRRRGYEPCEQFYKKVI